MSLLGDLFIRPTADLVVRDHAAMVFRQLKRIFGPQAAVDDIFQNVFVEVIRSLPTFAGRAKLSTWIRRITWNVAYQEMRLSYRQPKTTDFDETDRLHNPSTDAEAVTSPVAQKRWATLSNRFVLPPLQSERARL